MSAAAGTGSRGERNADATRARILEAAFREIYHKGYQGMRLDDVLQHTGLTKGALYHHFPNKLSLGYAVVEEVIAEAMAGIWIRGLAAASNPIDAISALVTELARGQGPFDAVTQGCPLNNLAQEMSPLDEGFRTRLDRVFQAWSRCLTEALDAGKRNGTVRANLDSARTATFIIAAVEGCIGMSKNAQSLDCLQHCTLSLTEYLDSLRG
jgi:AcrR family transcriptional regulator